MTTPNEHQLIEAAERLLRQQEQSIDELTSAKLRAARLRALEQAERGSGFAWFNGRSLIGAALAAVVAVGVWFTIPTDFSKPSEDAVLAQFDLPAEDNLELYDDLEFYGWLASQDDAS